MAPADLKQTLELAAKIVRIIEDLPVTRQVEVMAVAQTLVTIEAQRALRAPQLPEVRDE